MQSQIENLAKAQREFETKMSTAASEAVSTIMSQSSTVTNDDTSTIQELQDRITKIENFQNTMETNISTSVTTVMTKHIDEHAMPLHNALQKQVTEKNRKYDLNFEQMMTTITGVGTSYEEQISDLKQAMEISITASVKVDFAAFTSNNNPPSGTQESSHGFSQ